LRVTITSAPSPPTISSAAALPITVAGRPWQDTARSPETADGAAPMTRPTAVTADDAIQNEKRFTTFLRILREIMP